MNKHNSLLFVLTLVCQSVFSQYSGTLKIGGSNPDFQTINEAFDSLELNGVTSSVRLEIREGTYNEQITIDSIPGVNRLKQVYLVPDPQNSKQVMIQHLTSSATPYILQISQPFINVDSLSFDIIDSKLTRHRAQAIQLTGSASHIRINANSFEGLYFDATQGAVDNIIYLYRIENIDTVEISITNNSFLYGFVPIGSSRVIPRNHEDSRIDILGNSFDSTSTVSVWLNGADCLINISDNTFTNTITDRHLSGFIFISKYNNTEFNITKNLFRSRNLNVIKLISVDGQYYNEDTAIIANNIFDMKSYGTSLHLFKAKCKVYHNSFVSSLNAGKGDPLCVFSACDIWFHNNLVQTTNNGIVFDFWQGNQLVSDHNVYFNNNGIFARKTPDYMESFDSFRTVYATDSNSRYLPISYSNLKELRMRSAFLDGQGDSVGITSDFYGNPRSGSKPDIGAEEFTATKKDLDFRVFELLDSTECNIDTVHLRAVVINHGSQKIDSIKLKVNIYGTVDSVIDLNTNLNLSGMDVDTIDLKPIPIVISGRQKMCLSSTDVKDSFPENDLACTQEVELISFSNYSLLGDTICSGSSFRIYERKEKKEFKLYTADTSTKAYFSGKQFKTNPLSIPATYYYRFVNERVEKLDFAKPPSSGYLSPNSTPYGLVMTVNEEVGFDSATVYPSHDGKIIVKIWRKESNVYQLYKLRDSIPVKGSQFKIGQRIPIGVLLPPGEYVLGIGASSSITSMGRDHNYNEYPTQSSFGSINVTSATNNRKDVWYWYYDWKLTERGCQSDMDSIHVAVEHKGIYFGPDTSYCSNDSLRHILSTPYKFEKYQWSTGEVTPSIVVDTAGKYSLTATTSAGCTFYAEKTFTELEAPMPNLGPDSSYCAGQPLRVTLDAGPYQTYIWDDGSTARKRKITQPGSYTVEVADGVCTATDTINFKELPLPVISIPDTTACVGENAFVELDAGPGFKSYLWYPSGDTTQKLRLNSNGIVRITVENEFNCVASDFVGVTFVQAQNINLGKDTSICTNNFEAFTLSLDSSWHEIIWHSGDTARQRKVDSFGMYSVQALDSNGCAASDSIKVTALEVPDFDLSPDTLVKKGQPISIRITHNYSERIDSLLWSTGATTNFIIATDTGRYSLTITNSENCKETESMTIGFDTVTSSAIHILKQVLVIPNPTSRYVSIEGLDPIPVSYTLINARGQEVMKGTINPSEDQIDLGLLPAGAYRCMLNTKSNSFNILLLKLSE